MPYGQSLYRILISSGKCQVYRRVGMGWGCLTYHQIEMVSPSAPYSPMPTSPQQ
jgi:hypothetical protein